jgi:hypothetical protein
MRWFTSATEMFSIFAMFSRDSVALACKIFNSSSIIHLAFIFSVLAAGAVSRRLLTMSTRWRI